MRNFKRICWGAVLVFIGVILGLNALNITDIEIFFDGWWTLFIIVPSFIDLVSEKDKTSSLIGLLIGVSLLLCSRGIINFELVLKLIFPIILIIIGLSYIFKDIFRMNITKKISELNKKNENVGEYCSTFSSQKVKIDEEFKGCNLTSVFGGIDLDLRKSTIKKDCVINVTTIFGGVDIKVPENVKIKVKPMSIFGGVDDKTNNNNDDKSPIIYVNATNIFGGVEIK